MVSEIAKLLKNLLKSGLLHKILVIKHTHTYIYLHFEVFVPEGELMVGVPVSCGVQVAPRPPVFQEPFPNLLLLRDPALILRGVWLWYGELVNDPDGLL